jgi:hypothetical protein
MRVAVLLWNHRSEKKLDLAGLITPETNTGAGQSLVALLAQNDEEEEENLSLQLVHWEQGRPFSCRAKGRAFGSH